MKQHALDTNKSLKQLINEAIKEKIQYEREQLRKGNLKHTIKTANNSTLIISDNISELKEFLSNLGLLSIFENVCKRYNLFPDDLSLNDISSQLKSDLYHAIQQVYDEDMANKIVKKIDFLLK